MYKVVRRKALRPTVTQLEIEAPLVARKAKPGQFIILRVNEEGERIPLTVAGVNPEEGTVKIIFQVVGATTELLNHVPEGGYLQDFVGPLGNATETEGIKKVCIVLLCCQCYELHHDQRSDRDDHVELLACRQHLIERNRYVAVSSV